MASSDQLPQLLEKVEAEEKQQACTESARSCRLHAMPSNSEAVSLEVRWLSSVEITTVEMSLQSQIIELKQRLEQHTATPARFQRVLLGSKELCNTQTFAEAGLAACTNKVLNFIRVPALAWELESWFVKSDLNDMAIVRYILEHEHIHLNMKDHAGATLLHRAAYNGDVAACITLLQDDRSFDPRRFTAVNALDTSGKTALHYAALQGHTAVCQLLLNHKRFSRASAADNCGRTALDYAEEQDLPDVFSVFSKVSHKHDGKKTHIQALPPESPEATELEVEEAREIVMKAQREAVERDQMKARVATASREDLQAMINARLKAK